MVLCACFRPRTAYETETETAAPQTTTHELDVVKRMPDAVPAAASPAAARKAAAFDQTSSRDTHAELDSPRKAVPSPRPVLDTPTSIWEKLASHEIKNLSPTPEPREVAPAPLEGAFTAASGTAEAEREKTPDLTITGHSIKPLPAPAAAGAKSGSAKKPWGARGSNSGSEPVTPPARRLSGAGERRRSSAGTPPSAGVPASLLKPTAASAARAQATTKPKSDEAVWKH